MICHAQYSLSIELENSPKYLGPYMKMPPVVNLSQAKRYKVICGNLTAITSHEHVGTFKRDQVIVLLLNPQNDSSNI